MDREDSTGNFKLFDDADNAAITVDTNLNVGIGTNSPRVQTEIRGLAQATANINDTGNSKGTLQVSDTANAYSAGGTILFAAQNDSGTYTPQAAIKSLLTNGGGQGVGDLAFSTRNATADTTLTERMRITSGGDFGFNETTITNPYGQTNFTDLNIDGTWGGVISFKLGGVEKGWIGQRNSGNSDMVVGASAGQDLNFNTDGNNTRMVITSLGILEKKGDSTTARIIPETDGVGYLGESSHRWNAVYASVGTIQTSDVREKTEIKSTQLGLDFVNDLNPVSYKWIKNERLDASKDKRNHQGLIAQEVAETLEKHGVNKNDFGGLDIQKTDKYDDFHGMSYEQLVAPMIKAIQELKAKVDKLEQECKCKN